MKVGIIGCGKIFPMHAYSIKGTDGVELCAISDIDDVKLKKWTEKLSVRGYKDYKDMILTEKLDAVHICTPHYLHAEMSIWALDHGVNVLTEKPAAITLNDVYMMKNAKDRNNKALVVSFQNRFNDSTQYAKECVASGKLGKFVSGKSSLTWSRSSDYYDASGWKGTWDKEGGGLIIDQAIHTLDLVTWILADTPKVKRSYLDNWFHKTIKVEDTAQLVIEFSNDAKFVFSGNNFYSEDSPILTTLNFENGVLNFKGDGVEIDFRNGRVLEISPEENDLINIEGHKQYWGTSHLKEIRNYYSSLLGGNLNPKNSIEECITTHKLIEDIYESSPFSKGQRRNSL